MMLAAATSLMIASAAPLQPPGIAGTYVTGQMEMGGALELGSNGHFRYQLDYGAASESAAGDWTADAKTVRLTSNPMPKLPDFALVSDQPAPAGDLYVALDPGSDTIWTPLTVVVTIEGMDRPVAIYAEDDGRVVLPPGRKATSVKLLLPVYETGEDSVSLSADRGHRLTFKVEPNDMGSAAFRSEPLTLEGSSLVMHRYDTKIVFRKAKQ